MANKERLEKKALLPFPLEKGQMIYRLLEGGYQEVKVPDAPEGISVYLNPRTQISLNGISISRCVAVDRNGIVGWPQITRAKDVTILDPVGMAITNLLGRQAFARQLNPRIDINDIALRNYVLKKQGKLLNSLGG